MTLAAITAVAALAAVRGAFAPGGLLREWSLAIAALVGVAGCLLTAVAVAHVGAKVVAMRLGAGRVGAGR